MSKFNIVHISSRKFELYKNDNLIGYLDYHEGEGSLYLDYVFVNPEMRGQGIGKIIVIEGIKLAKSKNISPKPICGYASKIMKRNNWQNDFNE